MPRKFVVVAVLELLVGAVIVFYAPTFTLPGRQLAGSVKDFPVSETPYAVMDGERVAYFLVNMSGEWLAFVPAETNPNVDCPVRWDERRQIFSGPCLGTRYRLTGEWCDGPAVRNLDQYPVEINNDRVWVHTDYVIAGEATAVYKAANGNRSPGCPIPP